MRNSFRLLGLSPKASKVYGAVIGGSSTPLHIMRLIGVSRPTVYHILKDLKSRGLVKTHIRKGKTLWRAVDIKEFESAMRELKHSVFPSESSIEDTSDQADIIVHRGDLAVKQVITQMVRERKNQRLLAVQGANVLESWREIIGLSSIDEINKAIKENRLVVDAILPGHFFEGAITQMGMGWAKEFQGRATQVTVIEDKYFNHKAELFLFKDALYLISMSEKIVIEIQNSEIQKMIAHLAEYIQETARSIDANELLRKLTLAKPDAPS